jgi:hypothetical protein
MVITPLSSTKYEKIFEEDSIFEYPNMVRVRSIGGPSSFMHAIFLSFFIPYRMNKLNGTIVTRHDMIYSYRMHLAIKLSQLEDPSQSDMIRVYDCLGKGKNREIASAVKSYSIEVMQSELLDKSFFIDDKYLELISNDLYKDIYIIDGRAKTIYVKSEDPNIFYKKRGSIVLLALPNHFELIGLSNPNDPEDIITYFNPDSPFINYLNSKYFEQFNSEHA